MFSNRCYCWIAVALVGVVTLGVTVSAGPFTDAQRQQFDHNKQMCAKILRASAENVERYSRSDYPEDHDTACFIRCYGILNGMYDDQTGVNVDGFYVRFGGTLTPEEYAEESKPCLELQQQEDVECYCMKAYKPGMCLLDQFKKRNTL